MVPGYKWAEGLRGGVEVVLTCDKPNISWTTGKTLERAENCCKAGCNGLPGSLACVLIVFKFNLKN